MSLPHKHLDGFAVGTMLILCVIWGFNHVAAKLAAPGVSYVMQAGIRSIVAALLVLGWARYRGIALWNRDGSLRPGLFAGALFAIEFFFIFAGLAHTTAARMAVFVYLAPCVTAIGLAWLVPSERLTPIQTLGVVLGFAGIAVAFADGLLAPSAESTWLGDALGALAGVFWGATTVAVRATRLAATSATKTLLYQLGMAGATLPIVSVLMGESGITTSALTPVVLGSLVYQIVVIAFVTLLIWFWLLTRYSASKLSVLSFLAPLFGVLAGALVLGEPISSTFASGAMLVGLGIALVNARR